MATDALVSQFAETLATMAKEELPGAEDAVPQLEENVRAFSRVLQDAEHRAFTSYAIRGWLADVKDLVYDADDIIDYSRTHAARLSSEPPVSCYSRMLSFYRRVALRHRTGNMITSVIGRVERIRKRLFDLGLIFSAAAPRDDHDHDRGSSSWSWIQRQTLPLPPNDIVGSEIENGTSYLVGLLTREERELGGRRIRVVAITGMDGVGKTTLAQTIYNHPTIKDSFREPPPMWVCVSQLYSDEKLLRQIIRCAGGGVTGRHDSFAELQRRLATVIKGKKFFLVLDDVWDTRVWVHLLQNPLENGGVGSRVLITTRQPSVAEQMGAIYMHSVHPLTDEESWALLRKLVFQEDEKIRDESLQDIGMQIAIGCRGLPVAIRTVAGVLRTKSPTRWEWEKVLINPAWSLEEFPDGAMGVLYLSYKDLPLELKQCFIFCSLFPEDHLFERDTLTRLWVAEGFIAERGENVLLEDVADGYYNELLSKNILQREPAANERKCKMNVHLRSLTLFLARDEYGDVSQFVNATNTSSSSSSSSLMKLRHLLIVDTMHHYVVTQVIKENKSLRTLFLPKSTGDTTDFLFNKLGRLRVLSCSLVKSLPKSVGNLIHLRYLNLSWSSFVELPETVGNLSNLQYLNLNNCWSLKKLPRGIAKLYKLRFLDLEGTSVDGLPAGIGRLQHLNCLKGFVTNEQDDNEDGGWCSLEELKSLSQLRTLTILNLERALIEFKDQDRDRGFQLERLRHLRYLELRCSTGDQQDWDDDEKQKMFQLNFEVNCVPPPTLETFKIYRYFGLNFPDWLITYFPSLTTLELWDCKYCKQLPALGLLPKLNELSISRASSVESIGPEFMGMGMRVDALAFPMLTTLKLEFMPNLVEWQWGSVAAMPRLEELSILKCPKLRSLPDGLGSVTTLTTLSIQDDESLSVIENLHSLKVLLVWGNNNLTRVYNLPALQTMEVYKCNAPREVEGLYSLQSLYIYATEMESLPEWLLLKGGQPAFPMLKSLRIEVYKNVQVLHSCLVDGLDWPKIQHYPQVHITKYNMGYELFVRYTKYPFTFTTNLKVDGSAGDGGATAYPEN